VGTLVVPPPTKRRGTAVVVLGGSGGGLDERGATTFAEAGFIALALAYFGVGSLPTALVEIPVEYVGAGLDWLRTQPEVGGRRVGLIGRSKGGELALRAAATYPEDVSAVVGYTPSPVAWQGLPADRRGWREGPKSSWSFAGVPVPFLPFARPRPRDRPRFALSMLAGNLAVRPVYERALADDEARERAMAPLEDTAGPILLISGGDDQMWPAVTLCELALAWLARHERAFSDQHLSYEGAGHLISPPGHRTTQTGTGRFAFGGSPGVDAEASADSWPRVLDFLDRHV